MSDILQDRYPDWGDPVETHNRISQVWSGVTGYDIKPYQVALMMVGLKLVRADRNPFNPDSPTDGHGYLDIFEQLVDELRALRTRYESHIDVEGYEAIREQAIEERTSND